MKMASILVCLIFFGVFFPFRVLAFDVKGPSPTQPHGVFSTFSTQNGGKGVVSLGFEFEQSVDPSFFRLSTTASYALSDYLELSVTSPYMLRKNGNGFEDVHFTLKQKIIDEEGYIPSIAYLISGSPDIELKRDSLGGRFGGGLIFSKKIGPFRTHTNFFFFEPGEEGLKSEYDILAGIDFPATHTVNVLTELVTKKSHFSSSFDHIEGKFGYRYRPANFLTSTLGMGYEFKKREPEWRFFLSVTFLYPNKEDKRKRVFEIIK